VAVTQNRGGLGIKVAKLNEDRGDLVGALIVDDDDEVLVVLESGKVVRSSISEVPAKGRDTMGVVFARFAEEDRILAIAKNSERNLIDLDEGADGAGVETAAVESENHVPGEVTEATDGATQDVETSNKGNEDTDA
jgi:DNA gyrase subunit A